ncbi:tetratricopeptide repeat-containing sulfotransferase family protein [Pseudoalteromonas mariniglutinosa]|uniref:tetratricopeptide repeat-containing sulfotransferase family protein n=1 Tax=Pseudoalteromonas mariniglutinosa TaxID=206042 RepID=UPI00384BD1C4
MTTAKDSLALAVQQLNRGDITQGKRSLERLSNLEDTAEQALMILFKVAMHETNVNQARLICQRLISLVPDKYDYTRTLAELYIATQEGEFALTTLQNYLSLVPDHAEAHYQLGHLARKLGKADMAKQHLQEALQRDYQDTYSVYLELAQVYSEFYIDHQAAIDNLQHAISIEPRYADAYFNLANLFEQLGDKQHCSLYFKKVLTIDPHHSLAHARLADVDVFTDTTAAQYEQRSLALLDAETDDVLKADLYYALGKVFNDSQNYQKAWHYYVIANQFNRRYIAHYDRSSIEAYVEKTLVRKLEGIKAINDKVTPIIICGMFRSGSTLIEQIVSASERVSAGGEIDYLHKQLFSLIGEPELLLKKVNAFSFSSGYSKALAIRADHKQYVTDKRPENYLYIDIIKQLYPQAKVIWTQRDIRDNSLSAYFQHLGASLNYATCLDDTVHYYQMQQQVKAHWQQRYPNDIFTVDYDQLVQQPETVLSALFGYLGIQYQGEGNVFHKQTNTVSTASVWQVRRPLYQSSSGRYRDYQAFITAQGVEHEFIKMMEKMT